MNSKYLFSLFKESLPLQRSCPEVIKLFFMLNSILNAHKRKNIEKNRLLSGSGQPIMLFFLLINVKMPTIVGIFIFMSRKISCPAELSTKKVL